MIRKTVIFILGLLALNSYSQLVHLATYTEGDGGIEGLHYPVDIATDSHENIYVISSNTITHLQADESYTAIRFIEKWGYETYDGLGNADEIISANNGKFYYVTGDNNLYCFSKNDSSGKLDSVQHIEHSDSLSLGYASSTVMIVPPDDSNLYVATYKSFKNYLHIFKIDPLTGNLSYKGFNDDIGRISDMAASDDFIYASSFQNDSSTICVFGRSEDRDSLNLVFQLTPSDSISAPSYLELSTDNKFLYIYDDKSILVYKTDLNSGELNFVEHIMIDDYVDHYWFARDMLLSSDNKNLYVPGLYSLLVFTRNIEDGTLSFQQVFQEDVDGFQGFDNIYGIHLNSSGNHLLVASRFNDNLLIFSRDTIDGILTYQSSITDGKGKIRGLENAKEMLISHNDKHLYTLADGGFDIVNQFSRFPDGNLNYKQSLTMEDLGPSIGGVWAFRISPNDKNMYISSSWLYGIRILSVDSVTGDLEFYKSYTGEGTGVIDEGIYDISIPDDGRNLYATTKSYIINYGIDQDSADLTYLSKLTVDEDGSAELKSDKSIISSHDGKNVYTSSDSPFHPIGIVAYRREEDGDLVHLANYLQPDYTYGQAISSMVLSPDDRYFYVAGTSLKCFARDTSDGNLTYRLDVPLNDPELGNLYVFDQITMSRDGRSFIGVANYHKMVVSFDRDTETGQLTLLDVVHFSDDYNYNTSRFPRVTFSNDQQNVYVVSATDRTLTAFDKVEPLNLPDDPDQKEENAPSVLDGSPVRVFPNPFTEELHLKPESSVNAFIGVKIYDLQGRIVYASILKLPEFDTLDLSALHSGTYVLELNSESVREQLLVVKY